MNPVNISDNDLAGRIQAHRAGVVQKGRSYQGGLQRTESQSKTVFGDVLKSKIEEVKFSAHASSRLKSRKIDIGPEVMSKLEKAILGAEQKGAKDSLILLSDLAFIVNIPNKTVITAMDGESIRDNVFTNIDSTVIAG
ncbi:TIGR02530 family flagellar biosynthesis protein [Chitinispirillales bacterium ANBcel5]|uniref:TIGR02530 family flagellar biosynthesis protein n=1 Tax=Cellulosispirillum alkaliphilum TaxID=3039283 RepID=UPI002A54CBC7|nr:TIGR02530 family flagellar biosynthesis protein [Chitinispirillales bacterium ANBcel5]